MVLPKHLGAETLPCLEDSTSQLSSETTYLYILFIPSSKMFSKPWGRVGPPKENQCKAMSLFACLPLGSRVSEQFRMRFPKQDCDIQAEYHYSLLVLLFISYRTLGKDYNILLAVS